MTVADDLAKEAIASLYRLTDELPVKRGAEARQYVRRVEAEIARLEQELGRKPEWVTCDYQPEKRQGDEGGVPCRRAMSILVERAEAAGAEVARLRGGLRRIEEQQPKTVVWLRANNIVFDDLTDHWQKVAFSIYNDLCETDAEARALLAEDGSA